MASNMRAGSEFSVDSHQADVVEQKRKGGRKAKYTEEARKQRNRDAQAAFRERRTEYIKELEDRVRSYSSKLRSLEIARSSSADECLMLRYKNSLLERILMHKGIDVHEELNMTLWRPAQVPVSDFTSRAPDRYRYKRKANTLSSSPWVPPSSDKASPTTSLQSLTRTSTSPEIEAVTPPTEMKAPPAKRSSPDERRNFLAPKGPPPKSNQNGAQRPVTDLSLANPTVPGLDFLDFEDDPSMINFGETEFSMDDPWMAGSISF